MDNNLEWMEHLRHHGEMLRHVEFNGGAITGEYFSESTIDPMDPDWRESLLYKLEYRVRTCGGNSHAITAMKRHLYADLINDLNKLEDFIYSGADDKQTIQRIAKIREKYS